MAAITFKPRFLLVYLFSMILCASYFKYQASSLERNLECITESAGSTLEHGTSSVAPHHRQNPFLNISDPNCDPYLQPGVLMTNKLDRSKNFWRSFNPECPRAPHFLPDVLQRKPLSWLQDKTLLLIGDSVDRNNLDFFCELLNSSDHMTLKHELMYSNITVTTPTESYVAPDQPMAVCRIHEYNFEIAMWWQCGFGDEDVFEDKCYSPRLYPERVPMLIQLFQYYGRKPDLISIGSGWAKIESLNAAPVQITLAEDLVEQWIDRAEKVVNIVESIFPATFMLWRTLHYCRVDWGSWWLENLPESVDKTHRAPFHDVRVFQMNNAYTRLIQRKPHLYRMTWGELLTGHKEDYPDNIHPAKEDAGVLWVDMILYYLSRLKSEN